MKENIFFFWRAVSSSYVKAWKRPQVSRARGAETRVECDAVHPNLPHGTWSARVSRHVSRARAAFDPRRRARGPIFTRFSRKRQRVWPVFSQATSGREFHEPARRIRETRARVDAPSRAQVLPRRHPGRARLEDHVQVLDGPEAKLVHVERESARRRYARFTAPPRDSDRARTFPLRAKRPTRPPPGSRARHRV